MQNKKIITITNIFFFPDKNILTIKGLNQNESLETFTYPLFLNNVFMKNISFESEFFLEKMRTFVDERAFECKQNLDQLKGVDLTLNTLCIFL